MRRRFGNWCGRKWSSMLNGARRRLAGGQGGLPDSPGSPLLQALDVFLLYSAFQFVRFSSAGMAVQ
jgi:hypothetical protein